MLYRLFVILLIYVFRNYPLRLFKTKPIEMVQILIFFPLKSNFHQTKKVRIIKSYTYPVLPLLLKLSTLHLVNLTFFKKHSKKKTCTIPSMPFTPYSKWDNRGFFSANNQPERYLDSSLALVGIS